MSAAAPPTPRPPRNGPATPASHATLPWLRLLPWSVGALALGSLLVLGDRAQAQVTVEPPNVPQSLKTVPRPEPSNLGEFVQSKSEAIALGKALFWDMQLGSDGKTACASCHFQAGADSRSKNQLSPGLNRMASPTSPNPDTTFQLGGVNYQFQLHDFPLHRLADPNNRHSTVVRSVNDVAASQGVFLERFAGISATLQSNPSMPTPVAGAVSRDPFSTWYSSTTEQRTLVADPLFRASGVNTRRVEPRNTPTVINAVFNFRNFWDGRAEHVFNGVNPFGLRDPNARVYKNVLSGSTWSMQPTQVRIDNASLASQASGPPLSHFEMSAEGRSFPDIGRKMLYQRPLQHQSVSATDSVLGVRRHGSGKGLNESHYAAMVQKAFRSEWWNGSHLVQVNADGSKSLAPMGPTPAANQYTQMQHNFSLFFGLALQLYQATLVSDDAPFDRWSAGNSSAMSTSAQTGFGVFMGKGRCVNCHGGAEFTNASVRKMLDTPMARMPMGNGSVAVYDEGFYNIGVRPTLDDLGLGGKDPFGNPLSISALAQISSAKVNDLVGIKPKLKVSPDERVASNGHFKTPTLRNVELTGPYFHNGDSATLRQVVEFYNRGGNFHDQNLADLDADITTLGLTENEKTGLVNFMIALTDERVRYARAPFDHPQLFIPNGHTTAAGGGVVVENGRAQDTVVELPAIGAAGRSAPLPNFLYTTNTGFELLAEHSGKCVDVAGRGTQDGTTVQQWSCNGQGNQKWEQVPVSGGFLVRSIDSGKCLDVAGGSTSAGTKVALWSCHGGGNQVFNWSGLGKELKVKHSGLCLNVSAGAKTDGAALIQWTCSLLAANDNFRKR